MNKMNFYSARFCKVIFEAIISSVLGPFNEQKRVVHNACVIQFSQYSQISNMFRTLKMRFHIFILGPHFDIHKHNSFTNIFYTFSFYVKIIKIRII